MKKVLCLLLISAMLIGCSSNNVQTHSSKFETSTVSEPVTPSNVQNVIDMYYALNSDSTLQDYDTVLAAYNDLAKSEQRNNPELDEIKSKLNKEMEAKTVEDFIVTVENLSGDPNDAIAYIDDLADKYQHFSAVQEEQIPLEVKEQYEALLQATNTIRDQQYRALYDIYLQSETVVLSQTGSKYHTSFCRTLKYTGTEISAKQAIDWGYPACDVCHPPVSYDNASLYKYRPDRTIKPPRQIEYLLEDETKEQNTD